MNRRLEDANEQAVKVLEHQEVKGIKIDKEVKSDVLKAIRDVIITDQPRSKKEVPNCDNSNDFFNDYIFLYQDKEKEANDDLLWDDYDILKDIIKSRKDIFLYTLVEGDDDTAYISKGYHWVNRMGYYVSTNDIRMDDDIEL